MTTRWLFALCLPFVVLAAYADGPGDNVPEKVRPIPPLGVEIPSAARGELQKGVEDLGKEIEELKTALEKKPALLELLPDVQIFHKAVSYALTYNEFYIGNVKETEKPKEIDKQLDLAQAAQAGHGAGRATQTRQVAVDHRTGLVVRGYVSKIDGSVQPYGLVCAGVVSAEYTAPIPPRHLVPRPRRDADRTGLSQRPASRAEFAARKLSCSPLRPLLLRQQVCRRDRLSRSAGNVRKHYPIDENRLVIRGFSMGGAACWQFAVHYPGPVGGGRTGRGLLARRRNSSRSSRTRRPAEPGTSRKLWHLYDCTDYAVNLFNCPTVAYSGEMDPQKQAADMMAAAMKKEGLTLVHLIGPKTGHGYD